MTHNTPPRIIRIPKTSLLPRSDSTFPFEDDFIPSPSTALLGPLPPTSVFHLALNYLSISDANQEDIPSGSSVKKARVMVITGPRAQMHDWLEEEDEAWMRTHSGHYGVLDKLKRIDMRYAKTCQI
jgi:hypothetical protein